MLWIVIVKTFTFACIKMMCLCNAEPNKWMQSPNQNYFAIYSITFCAHGKRSLTIFHSMSVLMHTNCAITSVFISSQSVYNAIESLHTSVIDVKSLHCRCFNVSASSILCTVHTAQCTLTFISVTFWYESNGGGGSGSGCGPIESETYMVSHTVYRICGKRWRRIEWWKEMVKWIVRLPTLLALLLLPQLQDGGEYYTSCSTGFFL